MYRFKDIPAAGKVAIVGVGAMTALIAAVAFATSYNALFLWISGLHLYSDRLNRVWPLLLDGAWITGQLAAILAGILRSVTSSRDVHRGWPATVMLLTGVLTVWFNTMHAGPTLAHKVAAALPPVLMMATFEISVSVVRWVMLVLGRPLSPIPAVTGPAGVVHASAVRTDHSPTVWAGGPHVMSDPASSPGSGNGQPGQDGDGDGWKRAAIEGYLNGLGPDQLGTVTGSEITVALAETGTAVSERYARRVLDGWRAARSNGKPRRR